MLGTLIRGYAKSNQLESSTDELHTRSLLWPEAPSVTAEGRASALSPPPTPYGSPSVRASPFDDRAGLELNETKDLRIIVAQDTFGPIDRPLVLFDTQGPDPTSAGPDSPSASTPGPRSDASAPAVSPTSRNERGSPVTGHARMRSSTISGASASWARATRDPETADHLGNVLSCMFGSSSAAKTSTSTKIHFLPGDKAAAADLASRTAPESLAFHPGTARAPLLRARTATHSVNAPRHQSTAKDVDSEPRDAVLITRLFSVSLPDARETGLQHRNSVASTDDVLDDLSPVSSTGERRFSQPKRPKPVEKKTPIYAIGLLCYLARQQDGRPSTAVARPSSKSTMNHHSAPNSYGSDSLSTWNLLNAISENLLSSDSSGNLAEKGIEVVTHNFDVILRSIAVVEAVAQEQLRDLLHQVDLALIASAAKAPKGPAEQRTNQRSIYLRVPNMLAQAPILPRLLKHTLWRVSYAMRLPRVLTGYGLDDGGHWLDEARYLVRLYGNKQQNFFVFNLLTAFLGNHTEWLEKLGPDWYRKQFKAMKRNRSGPDNLASRTVIVCENRSTARRLIFLLASFLPRSQPYVVTPKLGNDVNSPMLTPDIVSASPAGRSAYHPPGHRHTKSRDGSMAFNRRELAAMSTSASSTESVGEIARAIRNRPQMSRRGSDIGSIRSIRHSSVFSPGEGPSQFHKADATSSTVTPNTGTPIPHFATRTTGYFDHPLQESAVVDGDAGASADLSRILRRDSTSQSIISQNTTWGSFINNVSGLWGKRQESSATSNDRVVTPTYAGGLSSRRSVAPKSVPIYARSPNKLEVMVNEAGQLLSDRPRNRDGASSVTSNDREPQSIPDSRPPRLTVDDKDGVVDVDINMPGFAGWEDGTSCSPPSSFPHQSSSFFSNDASSSFSSISRSKPGFENPSPNVAGYLKRYHEDFCLQAVKPYSELQEEIVQSMMSEPTPAEDSISSLIDDRSNGGDLWVNVCSTLIADARTFTIQRLTLSRRVDTDSERGSTPPTLAGASHATPVPKNAKGSKTFHIALSGRERLVSEKVMDFDSTVTDALERVLNETDYLTPKSNVTSRTHSRTVSTGTQASEITEPVYISAGASQASESLRPLPLSQSDCRQAVVGALEEVVKSVNDALAKHHRIRDADGHLQLDGRLLTQELKQDNVLREGVKKWLLNVETRSVW